MQYFELNRNSEVNIKRLVIISLLSFVGCIFSLGAFYLTKERSKAFVVVKIGSIDNGLYADINNKNLFYPRPIQDLVEIESYLTSSEMVDLISLRTKKLDIKQMLQTNKIGGGGDLSVREFGQWPYVMIKIRSGDSAEALQVIDVMSKIIIQKHRDIKNKLRAINQNNIADMENIRDQLISAKTLIETSNVTINKPEKENTQDHSTIEDRVIDLERLLAMEKTASLSKSITEINQKISIEKRDLLLSSTNDSTILVEPTLEKSIYSEPIFVGFSGFLAGGAFAIILFLMKLI